MNKKRRCGIYLQGNTTQPQKKNENFPLVSTEMDLEGIVKLKKSDKDKYCIISFICGIFKK